MKIYLYKIPGGQVGKKIGGKLLEADPALLHCFCNAIG